MTKYHLCFRIPLAILMLLTIGLMQSSSSSAASLIPTNLGDEIFISVRESDELRPKIAYNSVHDEYLVVWKNVWPGGHHDIYAQRISGSGRLLSWFAVASNTNSQRHPDVAYDPIRDRYLVVFVYDHHGDGSDWDINGRFIPWNGPDPGLLDFGICTWTSNQSSPSVAFANSAQEFLVTWTNSPGGVPYYVSAQRVYAAGGLHGSGFTVSSGTEPRFESDVAYNLARNEYLVTYNLVKGSGNWDVAGVRLNASGQPLLGGNPHEIGEFTIAGWPDEENSPAIAACHNADQYMVTWRSDKGTGGADFAIYARYLSGEAVPGSVHLIADTTSLQFLPDIACDAFGKRYLLLWSDQYTSGNYGIWARFAYPNATLDPEFGVIVPGAQADRLFPAVAGGKANFMTAWEHERNGGTNRDIHGRLIGYFLYLPMVIK